MLLFPGKQPLLLISINLKPLKPAIKLPQKDGILPMFPRYMDFFLLNGCKFVSVTLPETNSSHLKMDGWNTIVSFWDGPFSGANC